MGGNTGAAEGGTDVDPATGNPIQYTNLSAWAQELRQLSGATTVVTPALVAKRAQMEQELQTAVRKKLKPLPLQPAVPPLKFNIGQIKWTNEYGQPQAAIQITWFSRSSTVYQLQLSADNVTWTNVGDPVPGNNGPIILTQPFTELNLAYRLAWRANPDKELVLEPKDIPS